MADRALKTSLAEIVDIVNANKNVLDALKSDSAVMKELLHNIFQRVEDISMKFDETINSGLKKPKIVPKKVPTKNETPAKKIASKSDKEEPSSAPPTLSNIKLIKNIMTYFKTRYIEDNSAFDDILEENQADSLFAEHAVDLNAKKEGANRNKAKATLLYQNMSSSQKKKIREKMMDEYDKANVDDDEDISEEQGSQSPRND
jgi:hypothetical protein